MLLGNLFEDHSHLPLWWLVLSDPLYLLRYQPVEPCALNTTVTCPATRSRIKSILPPSLPPTHTHTHRASFLSVLSLQLHPHCVDVQFTHEGCNHNRCCVVGLEMLCACFWLLQIMCVCVQRQTVVFSGQQQSTLTLFQSCAILMCRVFVVNKPQE